MKVMCFKDTDTLLDLDAAGDICSMTVEHAGTRAGPGFFLRAGPRFAGCRSAILTPCTEVRATRRTT